MPSSSAYQTVPFNRRDQSSTPMISTKTPIEPIPKKKSVEDEGEKHELNLLNNRFGNYLEKIKHLATINAHLRRQVDDAYRKCVGHTDDKTPHPSQLQLNYLRDQITEEVRAQTTIQIRLQRAEYDMKFYQNNIKLFSTVDQQQSQQIQQMRQQLQFSVEEFEQLKEQYSHRERDLQLYRSQYNELINKLIEFSNDYDRITSERMEYENNLHTLKERVTFEQEYHQRRVEELKYFEQFHRDFHRDFHRNEFDGIVRKIRDDYQEFNTGHLSELKKLYENKLETVQQDLLKRAEEEKQQDTTKPHEVRQAIDSTKKEYRVLIEQNHLLKDKLEQLQNDLQKIIEQNRQRYEVAEREYQQLQMDIPELDCIIVHLRENAVNLWSEINTYRYLLLNLLSTSNEKPSSKIIPIEKTSTKVRRKSSAQQYRDESTGFVVHVEDGIIWVRI